MANGRGEVTERLKVLASKASVRETVPWVRIPPSLPYPRQPSKLAYHLTLVYCRGTVNVAFSRNVRRTYALANQDL